MSSVKNSKSKSKIPAPLPAPLPATATTSRENLKQKIQMLERKIAANEQCCITTIQNLNCVVDKLDQTTQIIIDEISKKNPTLSKRLASGVATITCNIIGMATFGASTLLPGQKTIVEKGLEQLGAKTGLSNTINMLGTKATEIMSKTINIEEFNTLFYKLKTKKIITGKQIQCIEKWLETNKKTQLTNNDLNEIIDCINLHTAHGDQDKSGIISTIRGLIKRGGKRTRKQKKQRNQRNKKRKNTRKANKKY